MPVKETATITVGGEVFNLIDRSADGLPPLVEGMYGKRYRDATWREIHGDISSFKDFFEVSCLDAT